MKTSDQILESITPKKINKLIDWLKYNVNPGNGEYILPEVAGISIEFFNENSLNFKQQVNSIFDSLPNQYIEKSQHLKIFQMKKLQLKKTNNQNLKILNHQMKSFN